MIVFLRGPLVEKADSRVVIDANGVGYEAFISLATYDALPPVGEEVVLKTAHIVREDDEVLYGFATDVEREMFGKLIGVSGVGPRIALALLSGISLSELTLAISTENAKRLSAVKGVGKKIAEKICVELKDKVNALEAVAMSKGKRSEGKDAMLPIVRDAILALTALGFTEEAATHLISKVLAEKPAVDTVEEVVRLALSQRGSG